MSEVSGATKWLSESAPSKWMVQVPGERGWAVSRQNPRTSTYQSCYLTLFHSFSTDIQRRATDCTSTLWKNKPLSISHSFSISCLMQTEWAGSPPVNLTDQQHSCKSEIRREAKMWKLNVFHTCKEVLVTNINDMNCIKSTSSQLFSTRYEMF